MCICCIILCPVLLLCKINYVIVFCHNLLEGMLVTSWEIDGETVETVADFIFGGSKSLQMVTAAMKLKDAYSLEGKL